MKRLLTILFTLGCCAGGFSQADTLSGFSAGSLKNFAKNAERLGDAYSAVSYYDAYLGKREKDTGTRFHLAKLQEGLRDYVSAGQNYFRVYEEKGAEFPEALYDYARMQILQGRYDEARKSLVDFIPLIKKTDKRSLAKVAEIDLAGCDSAKMLMAKPVKAQVQNLGSGINSPHIDFSPVIVDETHLIFASLPEDGIRYYEETDPKPRRQFYTAEKKGNGWLNKGLLEGPVNDPGSHTGNGVFTPDGQKFFFTRCEQDWKNQVTCQIWMSKKNGSEWGEPVKLDESINVPGYSSTQPAIGIETKKKQEILYFVSDRPEGYGGTDIWYSTYDEKSETFKEARNVGKSVNTPRNEMTPFYFIPEKKLYFSTEGRAGLGGMDVFQTRGELKNWSTPINVGYPLNSSVDDIYFVMAPDAKSGFLVSNRSGGQQMFHSTCCDDIYSFEIKDKLDIAISGAVVSMAQESYLNGLGENLSNIESDKVLKDVTVGLYVVDGAQQILVKQQQVGADGKYFFPLEQNNEYRILFAREGYFSNEIYVSTKDMFSSDTLVRHLGMSEFSGKSFVIENIEYDYDSANLTERARQSINSTLLPVLKENPQIRIEIGAHTDNKGSDEYNLRLSQQRAQSVVDYLLANGISKDRMMAQGYGETKPVTANENPDGSDNPEGRQRNRRTEFKVIGEINLSEGDQDE